MIEDGPAELRIAKWSDRFFAWLIDFVVIWVGISIMHSVTVMAMWHGQTDIFSMILEPDHHPRMWSMYGVLFGSSVSIAFFLYWGILEHRSRQSLGKRVLNIKTVSLDGSPISITQSLLNSFGKSFLFCIDVILGLIFTRKRRQRIFNKLSNSIVIKIEDDKEPNVSYKMD